MDKNMNNHEKQIKIAGEHYSNLKKKSLMSAFLYAIPALLLTFIAVFFYFQVEDDDPVIHYFFINITLEQFLATLFLCFGVICWGLFFWIQVNNHRKNAKFWQKSKEDYEKLVISESMYKTEEEKRIAARTSVAQAQAQEKLV